MRLTKYTHACVRLEREGASLLIDPGLWTEDEAFAGIDHVLVTHEHNDHVDTERLAKVAERNDKLRVFAPAGVAESLNGDGVSATAVSVGDTFVAGGFNVLGVGGAHAEIYDGQPDVANIGFVVEGVYHPGDSFFVPSQRVETLLVPLSGPWFDLASAIDFTRSVKSARAFPIHDALLNDAGQKLMDRWIEMRGETEYARLTPGSSAQF
jgi:L-ascorbate metabolism protein UlaG (beta-lactamase superfamily)